jgi:hypothetical protein
MRTLFFGRLAEMNHQLNRSITELTHELDQQNHNASLGLLIFVDTRIQAMRNILLVLREYLGG